MADQPAEGSVPAIPLATRDPDTWTVLGAIVAVVAATAVGQLGGVALIHVLAAARHGHGLFSPLQDLPEREQAWLLIAGLITSQVVELAVIWWVAGHGGADRQRALGLIPVRLGLGGWLKAVFGVFAVKAMATLAVAGVSTLNPKGELGSIVEMVRDPGMATAVLVMVVQAGLIEELLYRGVLSRTLEATRLGVWGGAILANLVFAALHLQYGFGGQFVILALGLALSYIRRRTGSLWPGIVCHAVNNAVAVFAMRAIL